jgi:hypothetical protein
MQSHDGGGNRELEACLDSNCHLISRVRNEIDVRKTAIWLGDGSALL